MLPALAVFALPALVHAATPLKLTQSHQGSTFFDGWKVNGSDTDATQYGNIHYLNQSAAQAAGLIGVNDAQRAFLKVDNTTSDPNPGPYSTFGRNTVLLMSQDTITIGTLVALDAVHIPYGCSVWPAFWTLDSVTGTDEGGEIDIVEAVNLMQNNQFSLHARPGCTLTNSTAAGFAYTGSTVYTNCDYTFNTTGNRGCGIQAASGASLGAAFAQNNGGVYAMYWTTAGIQMWFFPRASVPADLTSESPDPTSWPAPDAAFPAAGCNPSTFFNPQTMILNIDVCGAWAGNEAVFTSTGCYGNCTSLVGIASNYDTAYWELNYVKTFTVNGSASANGSSTGTAGANATGGGSGTTTSPTGKSAATRTWSAERMAAAAAAAAAAAVLALALAA